ncbi:peptidase [Amycolatopsis acidicola]|uniref:Peptidase n=1 Tax=Amycolatopsis acidicola TaxID=2596893 RepID=A0A5N0USR1_9PSEU|nr:LON peptidase substrate-binding domain-containing protein [Amycolatopsis acidicola]KAA9152884.1 peptidase [Amycolatopsis acidicola]
MRDAERPQADKVTLPLFPLQTVLLPGAVLPLHLFEPRYRQLMVDLLSGAVPERRFGIIGIKSAGVREVDSVDHLHPIGCTALLGESERLPDGRFDVVTHGERRFRLLDLDQTRAPYLIGTVEWVPDEPVPAGAEEATERLSASARSAYRRYAESAWEDETWPSPPPETPPAELGYLLAANCLLPLPDRQRLLEETHPLRRLRAVNKLLSREAGFLAALNAVPAPPPEVPHLTTRACLN